MKSPLFPRLDMLETALEENLPVWQCIQSKGVYIRFNDYQHWLETTDEETSAQKFQPIEVTPEDARAKICPESGGLLRRFHISAELPIHLDWSPGSGGIWLDGGEWQLLKQHKLHRQLHNVISDSWQRDIRRDAKKALSKQRMEEKLGETDFQKAIEFKDWLSNHLHRSEILAFLQHND
ncbi:MAG: hypothetical protein ACRBF0_04575 [Calditrichia bacterium]